MERRSTSAIADLLGEGASVTLLGREIDLAKEVAIPRGEDLDTLLYDQPERKAAWDRIVAKCSRLVDKAADELDELKNDRFRQYWNTLEEKERQELVEKVFDETDADPFRRKQRVSERVTRGIPKEVPRWRRNFTDDLVWSYVHSDVAVVDAKRVLRVARNQLAVAQSVRSALEHKMRCISHLCARERNP